MIVRQESFYLLESALISEVTSIVESKIEETVGKIKEEVSRELVPSPIEIPSDAPPEVVEALQKLASHEKQHFELQAQVRKMEEALSKKADAGQTSADRFPMGE